MYLVFVYGTLKTGEPNHVLLEKEGCRYLGEAETVEKFPLVVGTAYKIPFIVYKQGLGHNIKGELYEVDEEALKDLDQLERHPDLYERLTADVRKTTGKEAGTIVPAFCYFLVQYRPAVLDLPMFESFSIHKEGMESPFPQEMTEEEREAIAKQIDWSSVHTVFR